MKRWHVLLLLLAVQASGGNRDRNRTERCREGCTFAAVEFAPAGGSGMSTECGNVVNPNSVGSIAGSFNGSRASSATCIVGNTIAIANGSMVTVSNNVVRVMRGGDGSGALGILQEEARTNLALRSQEFSNAAWSLANSGSVNPTVTADQGTAPDGTLTADRVQFGACASATNSSIIFQTVLGGAGTYTGSVLCKGTTISQTISVCAFSDGTNAGQCTQVVCPSTSWARTSQAFANTTTGGLVIGCNNQSNYTGATSTGTADVLLWGGDYELGAFATSYIATAGASAARVLDAASIGSLPTTLFNAAGSISATILPLNPVVGGVGAFGASQRPLYFGSGGTGRITMYDSSTIVQTVDTVVTPGPTRVWGSWSGSTMTMANATTGVTGSGVFNGAMQAGASTIEVANGTGGAGSLNGILKQFCLDSSPGRCR